MRCSKYAVVFEWTTRNIYYGGFIRGGARQFTLSSSVLYAGEDNKSLKVDKTGQIFERTRNFDRFGAVQSSKFFKDYHEMEAFLKSLLLVLKIFDEHKKPLKKQLYQVELKENENIRGLLHGTPDC